MKYNNFDERKREINAKKIKFNASDVRQKKKTFGSLQNPFLKLILILSKEKLKMQ